MVERQMEDPVNMARRKLWMIVVMAFVVGFLSGVAFSAYKLRGFGASEASKAVHGTNLTKKS